jgi:hypothetical protein
MNDDLISRLDDLARQPASRPDAAFADALEHRLRAAAATSAGPVSDASAPAGLAGPLRRRLAVSGAVVVAATAAVVAALVVPGALAHPRVQLAGATDTQVIGPDGRIGQAAPGSVIANGSIIRTGPAGQILAGGVVIGPNHDALAVDGQLHPVTSELSRDRRSPAGDGTAHPGGPRLTVRRGPAGDALHWTRFTGHGLYGYLILAASGAADPDSTRDAIGLTSATGSIEHVAGAVTYRIVAVDRLGRVLASSDDVSVG